MMIDQIYDRDYRIARSQLSGSIIAGLARLAASSAQAFTVLNRIEYSAPWNRRGAGVRCG